MRLFASRTVEQRGFEPRQLHQDGSDEKPPKGAPARVFLSGGLPSAGSGLHRGRWIAAPETEDEWCAAGESGGLRLGTSEIILAPIVEKRSENLLYSLRSAAIGFRLQGLEMGGLMPDLLTSQEG